MSTPYAVEFKHFDLSFGERKVLTDIRLAITAGSCVGIIGPNGSGKTSLLRSIVGLNKPDNGEIRVLGQKPSRAWRRKNQIGYVPQLKSIDKDFPISVYDVVMLGRVGKLGFFHNPGKLDQRVVQESLERVKMSNLSGRPIGELSGGQQQRVFIARALAQESSLLLLDEPATGLDIPTQQSIYELLESLHGDGITTLTTTHDPLALEFHHFDQILCLNQRVIAYGPPDQVLTTEVLTETFSGFPWPSHLMTYKQDKQDGCNSNHTPAGKGGN